MESTTAPGQLPLPEKAKASATEAGMPKPGAPLTNELLRAGADAGAPA